MEINNNNSWQILHLGYLKINNEYTISVMSKNPK